VEPRVTEVWVAAGDDGRGERRYALPPGTADERLLDLSWAPDGDHLLLVSQQRPQGGGVRTRLLWLELRSGEGTARELVTLPSEVVPGAYSWSPTGDRVAFLARSEGRTALCVLGTDGALFRSLADVGGPGGTSAPMPPLAWAPDGAGVVYAAPGEPASTGLFGPGPVSTLYRDDLSGRPGRRLGAATGQGPGWHPDGAIAALASTRGGRPPVLRLITPEAGDAVYDSSPLPLPAAVPAGARWDPARGQAIVALPGAVADTFDFWLLCWIEEESR
jgi:dipeptidyl aminopeptidase/acylaminoacyl peptidase